MKVPSPRHDDTSASLNSSRVAGAPLAGGSRGRTPATASASSATFGRRSVTEAPLHLARHATCSSVRPFFKALYLFSPFGQIIIVSCF